MSQESSTEGNDETHAVPSSIGRYQVQSCLGSGGFGTVYLALDEKLDRRVAIKVPHPRLVDEDPKAARLYLEEARVVATLDHPSIVPVYDIGSDDDFACYVVSKYISGRDLRHAIADRRPSLIESVRLVKTIALALQHAHKRGIVHRDVKPGNILLNRTGEAFIADFGLALPERRLWKGPQYAGTPAYMSPEQARGEGHRIDGRSDVFSLGAVLYECLTGRKAFRGGTKSELLEMVEHFDPRPIRQYDEKLPKELDRIVNKALAKRATERYSVAQDLADELAEFERRYEETEQATDRQADSLPTAGAGSTVVASVTGDKEDRVVHTEKPHADSGTPANQFDSSRSELFKIVPKGLRSFDSGDADFFLELLPGPRDREGLPENLRFWKSRLESTDVDSASSVGIIFGPSGCGKSSFVRAGLVPRLNHHVHPITIDATNNHTEARLLREVSKRYPELEGEQDLPKALSLIRRGGCLKQGQKLVIIIDQFERWLHSNSIESTNKLVRALRQCDGGRVQVLLLVRSDFWMAITQFLNELEVDCLQGSNFEAIDLLPTRHAEKTLRAFGQALGALPEGALSQDHEQFIKQSVEGLAKDGKVICVRLALYAEMMKNRPWTISSLKQTGGTEGVGLAFLEESFGTNANPKVRLHQRAARAVLKQLIPESGSLSMQMKSYQELMDASGYSDARMFDELMTLLDVEMRLLSPTDPAGVLESDLDPSEVPALDSGQRYYRLAHDYLVNALRAWLTRKQQETVQGRAELLLAERSAIWSSHSDRRFLPSLTEHGRIRLLTSSGDWTPTQAAMLKAAARKHGMAFLIAAAAVVAILFGANQIRRNLDNRLSADFVASLPQINTSQVARRMRDMLPYQSSVTPLLVEQFENAKADTPEKLHSAMALVGQEPLSTEYLFEQLPKLPAAKLQPICSLLKQQASKVPPQYSEWVADQERTVAWRLNCACVLAQFEADSEVWSQDSTCTFVAENLTTLFPSELLPIRELLEPVSERLSPQLRRIYADRENSSEARSYAADSWVFYNRGKLEELCDFLLSCDSRQFPLVMQALQDYESELGEYAQDELSVPSQSIADSERDFRIANAAVVLYQLGQTDRVWPLLRFSESPQVRSYLVHWIASHGSSPSRLVDRLSTEEDQGILQALLLALGEFEEGEFASGQLNRALDLAEQRVGTRQASLTAAFQWLAKQFGREFELAPPTESETATPAQRLEKWLASIESSTQGELPGIAAKHESVRTAATEMAKRTEQDLSQLQFVDGPTCEALRFDGGEVVELDRVQLPSLENGVSVSSWIRLSSVVQYSAVWSSMDPDQNFQGIDLWLEAGKLAAHVKKAYYEPGDERNSLLKVIGTTVGDNEWHQVTVTYDGSDSADSLKLYLDGVPVVTTEDEYSLDGAVKLTQPLTLGGRVGSPFANLRFKGDLGELHIYAANLPAQSVAANYNRELLAISRFDDRTRLQQQLLEAALAVHDEDSSGQGLDESEYGSSVQDLLESPQDWYWGSNQHQMLRIHAGTFEMGSGKGELHETEFVELQRSGRHRRTINRVFAMSAREVSIGQYQRLLDVEDLTEATQQKLSGSNFTKPELAMSMLNWFEAVQYCNWLNRAENIPEDQWCYVPDPEKGYAPGMQVKPEFWKLTGYRLPTQAEWEYACRANTDSHRHYGYSDSLLGEYAWFQFSSDNEPQACGVLKPNDWGFFDMQGNAMEWCFDLHADYPYNRPTANDTPRGTGVVTNENREIRGAAFYDLPQYMRSAYRYFNQPSGQLATGFRVCRTLADGVEPESQ